jgi:hypothetical protein
MEKFSELCFDELCKELSNTFYNTSDGVLMLELLAELTERVDGSSI